MTGGVRRECSDLSVAEALALPVQQAVLAQVVVEDGPVDQAWLRGNDQQVELDGTGLPTGGDIIIAIDGAEVRDMDDLIVHLAEKAVGQSVTLDINREGERQSAEVILAERPQDWRGSGPGSFLLLHTLRWTGRHRHGSNHHRPATAFHPSAGHDSQA